MKKNKLFFPIIIFIICIMIQTASYSKYIFKTSIEIANINIDRKPPVLKVKNISVNKTEYTEKIYVWNVVKLEVDVEEKNIGEDVILPEEIEVLVGGKVVEGMTVKIKNNGEKEDITTFVISISRINANGDLKIKFKEGAIKDMSNLKSLEYVCDTGFTLDNIAPNINLVKTNLGDGRVKVDIIADEKIRPKEGWNLDETKTILSKVFDKSVNDRFAVIDYAGNYRMVDVKIYM